MPDAAVGRTGRPKAGDTGLTKRRILAAAIDLIEQEGFDAFSMRSLAATLDVTATALYRHVPTRQHLLDLIADSQFEQLVVAEHDNWKESLTNFLLSVHRLVFERPLLAEVLARQPVDGITALRFSNTILGQLRRAGFDSGTAVEILTNLGSFTIGFTLHRAGREGLAAKDPDERARRLREQTADLYPELAAVADEWVRWSVETNFLSGLRRLIDSYEREL